MGMFDDIPDEPTVSSSQPASSQTMSSGLFDDIPDVPEVEDAPTSADGSTMGDFFRDLPNAAIRTAQSIPVGVRKTAGAIGVLGADLGLRPGDYGGEDGPVVMTPEESRQELRQADAESQQLQRDYPTKTELGGLVAGAGESIAYMAPMLPAGPGAAVAGMAGRTAIDTYGEARELEGKSVQNAGIEAVVSGTAEGALEMAPTAMLFDLFGKSANKSLAGKLVKYFAAEQVTEVPTTLIQNAADIYTSNDPQAEEKAMQYALDYRDSILGGFAETPDITVDGRKYNAYNDMVQTMKQTAVQAGLMGAPAAGLRGVHKLAIGEAGRAQERVDKEAYDALSKPDRKQYDAAVEEQAAGRSLNRMFGRSNEIERRDIDLLNPEAEFDVEAYLRGEQNDLSESELPLSGNETGTPLQEVRTQTAGVDSPVVPPVPIPPVELVAPQTSPMPLQPAIVPWQMAVPPPAEEIAPEVLPTQTQPLQEEPTNAMPTVSGASEAGQSMPELREGGSTIGEATDAEGNETVFVTQPGPRLRPATEEEIEEFAELMREAGVKEGSDSWNKMLASKTNGIKIRAIDPLSGYQGRSEFGLALPKIWERHVEGVPVTITEFDIVNLGGLNENIGEPEANKVLTDIYKIFSDTLVSFGIKDAQLFRNGGDEGQAVSTAPKELQVQAVAEAKKRIDAYVKEKGLEKTFGKTAKGQPKNTTEIGTGIYHATESFSDWPNLQDAIDAVKLGVNEAKRAEKGLDDGRTSIERPGTVRAEGQPASTEGGDVQDAPGAGVPPAQNSSTNLYSGIPLPELKKLAGNLKAAYPHLLNLGSQVYQAGHTTLDQFKKEMQRVLGDLYRSFKDAMIRVFNDVRARLKDERGVVGRDINELRKDEASADQVSPKDMTDDDVQVEDTREARVLFVGLELSKAKRQIENDQLWESTVDKLRYLYRVVPDKDLREKITEMANLYIKALAPGKTFGSIEDKEREAAKQRIAERKAKDGATESVDRIIKIPKKNESPELAKKDEADADQVTPKKMTDEERKVMHERLFDEQYRARREENEDQIEETVDFTDEAPIKDSRDYEDNFFPSGKEFFPSRSSGVQDKAKQAQVRELKDSQGMQMAQDDDAKLRKIRPMTMMESEVVRSNDALASAGQNIEKRERAAAKNNATADAFQEKFWQAQKDALTYAAKELARNPLMTTAEKGRQTLMQIIGNDLAQLAETFYAADLIAFIEKSKNGGQLATLTGYPDALTELLDYQERYYASDVNQTSEEATDEEAENAPRSIADRKAVNAEYEAERKEEVQEEDVDTVSKEELSAHREKRDAEEKATAKKEGKQKRAERSYARQRFDKAGLALFKKKDTANQQLISENWKGFFLGVADHIFSGKVNELKDVDHALIAHKMVGTKKVTKEFRDLYMHGDRSKAIEIVKEMMEHSILLLPFEKEMTSDLYRGEVELPARVQPKEKFAPVYTKHDAFIDSHWDALDKILKDIVLSSGKNQAAPKHRQELPGGRPGGQVYVWSVMRKDSPLNLSEAMNRLFDKTDYDGATRQSIFDEMLHRSGLTALKGSTYPVSEFAESKYAEGAMQPVELNPVDQTEETRLREVAGVKVNEDGKLLNYDFGNDIIDMIRDVVYSDLGNQIAEERGFPSRDAYVKHLAQRFNTGWPKVKNHKESDAIKKKRGQARELFYKEDLPLIKAARMERQYRDKNLLDKDFFEKIVALAPEAEMSAEEAYGIWIRRGNYGAIYAEVRRRAEENLQAKADKNFAVLKELRSKGARAIAESILTPAQQKQYGLARSSMEKGKPNFKGIDTKDRSALVAAFQIEQDLLAGREAELADLKLDHGYPVQAEDVFQRDLDNIFAEEANIGGLKVGKLRNEAAQKFYQAVAKAFGAELVVVSDPFYRSRYIGSTEGQSKIVVNVQESKQIEKLFAHELFHHVVNRADPAAYREFVRAVKLVVGQEKWDAAQARLLRPDSLSEMSMSEAVDEVLRDPNNEALDEEMLADLFTEVFTQTEFYNELAKTIPGRTMAQKIIGRLVNLVAKVLKSIDGKARWGYEEIQLLGPSQMSQILSLVSDLMSSLGGEKYSGERYFMRLPEKGEAVPLPFTGPLGMPKWSDIFPKGSKAHTVILDAIEQLAKDSKKALGRLARVIMADVGAEKKVQDLAYALAYTANQKLDFLEATVLDKHKDTFDNWVGERIQKVKAQADADLKAGKLKQSSYDKVMEANKREFYFESMHDDFVRRPDPNRIRQYPQTVRDAFADFKEVADDIHAELVKLDPEMAEQYRETHQLQTIRWQSKGALPFDDSFASLSARSKLEGDKNFLKTKDTERTTAEIRKDGFEYDTIHPLQMARNYIHDAYKLIAFREMIQNAYQTDVEFEVLGKDGKRTTVKKEAAKIFANTFQANKEGYRPVNDNATQILMGLNGGIGYRVKTDQGYLREDGVEMVFGTEHEANQKAISHRQLFGGAAKVEAQRGQKKVTEGPGFVVTHIGKNGERITGKRFDAAAAAREYADSLGEGYLVEKELIGADSVPVARIYFHPDLARMINRLTATNHLLSGSTGKYFGRPFMAVKNYMTKMVFAVSAFHAGIITQEGMNAAATYAQQTGKTRKARTLGYLKGWNPAGMVRNTERIASLFDYVLANPDKADDKAVQDEARKLFNADYIPFLKIFEAFGMTGGLYKHQDRSLQTASAGKMQYRSSKHRFEIDAQGKGQFVKGSMELQKGLPAMRKSVKKIFEQTLEEEPNAKIFAFFKAGELSILEGTSAWLMEYFIPRMKMAMFAREYLMNITRHEAAIVQGTMSKQQVAISTMLFIESKAGEQNWQNMWLEPTMKTALQMAFRSFTWIFGDVSAMSKSGEEMIKWGWVNVVRGNALNENRYKLTEKGWWAINSMVGHLMVRAALGTLFYLSVAGGDDDEYVPDDPNTPWLTTALFPRMNKHDPYDRLQFGSYITEMYKYSSHLGAFGNEADVKKLISGRYSDLLSQGYEAFVKGSDWQGVEIVSENDKPGIAFGKKLFHTLAVTPISLGSIYDDYKAKGFSAERTALSFAGLTSAPATSKRSPATNKAYAIARSASDEYTITEEKAEQRLDLKRAMFAVQQGNTAMVDKLITTGAVSPEQYRKALTKIPLINGKPNLQYQNPLQQVLRRLTIEQALEVWEEMNETEKKQMRGAIEAKYINSANRKNMSDNVRKEVHKKMKKYGIL